MQERVGKWWLQVGGGGVGGWVGGEDGGVGVVYCDLSTLP
jgi:hypothetical protein